MEPEQEYKNRIENEDRRTNKETTTTIETT